jgi:DNA modification methylase
MLLQFFLGDCLDVLSRLPHSWVNVIETSLPYNLGMAYRLYPHTQPREAVGERARPAPTTRRRVGSEWW